MGDKCGAHSHRDDGIEPAGPTPWSDGKRYWRSIDEMLGTPEFHDRLHREFPRYAGEWTDETSRRNFLKIMGASLALASAAGCFKKPEQEAAPYVQQPEMMTPGIPLHFTSVLPVLGYGRGVIVRSDEGKPTKIEGNEKHPASLGATDAVTQAHLLGLYDPDRSQSVINDGNVSSWDKFFTEPKTGVGNKLAQLKASKGKGLRLVTETITSPTLGRLLGDLFKALPEAKWYRHDPVGRGNARLGTAAAFGKEHRDVQPVYPFDKVEGRPGAGLELPGGRAGQPAVRPAVHRRPPGPRGPDGDEPPVRRSRARHDHRGDGRPPPGGEAQPGGGGRPPRSPRRSVRPTPPRPADLSPNESKFVEEAAAPTWPGNERRVAVVAGASQLACRPRPGARDQRAAR